MERLITSPAPAASPWRIRRPQSCSMRVTKMLAAAARLSRASATSRVRRRPQASAMAPYQRDAKAQATKNSDRHCWTCQPLTPRSLLMAGRAGMSMSVLNEFSSVMKASSRMSTAGDGKFLCLGSALSTAIPRPGACAANRQRCAQGWCVRRACLSPMVRWRSEIAGHGKAACPSLLCG
ncbi:hypothetical protein D9M69_597630 [compost metagenome]